MLVNIGCFSSTRSHKNGTSFNEELAALLATDGITVYGPPYAGVVTTATSFTQWKNLFGQKIEDETSIRSVPIQFQHLTAGSRSE